MPELENLKVKRSVEVGQAGISLGAGYRLIYGIEIYGNTCTKYLNKLMILNNKILRILQHAPLDTPVSQLYATFHTFPLPDLHNLQIFRSTS